MIAPFLIGAPSQDDAAAASLLLVDSLAAQPTATSTDALAEPTRSAFAPALAPAPAAPTSASTITTPTCAPGPDAANESEALLSAALRQLPAMRTHDLLRTLRALQIAGLPASILSPPLCLHVAFTFMHSPLESEQLLEALRLAAWMSPAHGVIPREGQQVQEGRHEAQQMQEQQPRRDPGLEDMDGGVLGVADAQGNVAADQAAAATTLGTPTTSSAEHRQAGKDRSDYISSNAGSSRCGPAQEDDPLGLSSPAAGGQLPGAYPPLVDLLVSRLVAGPGGLHGACDGHGGGSDATASNGVLVSAANTLLEAGLYHRGLIAAAAAATQASAVGAEGKDGPQQGLRALVDQLDLTNAARLLLFALARTGPGLGKAAAADAGPGTAAAAEAAGSWVGAAGGPVAATETAAQAGSGGRTGGEDSGGGAAASQPSSPSSALALGSLSPQACDREVALVLMQTLPKRLGMSMT